MPMTFDQLVKSYRCIVCNGKLKNGYCYTDGHIVEFNLSHNYFYVSYNINSIRFLIQYFHKHFAGDSPVAGILIRDGKNKKWENFNIELIENNIPSNMFELEKLHRRIFTLGKLA